MPTETSRTSRNAVHDAMEQLGGVVTPPNIAATNSGVPNTDITRTPMFSIRERTEMLTRYARENGNHHRFPGRREMGWYSRDLEGVPFVIVSEPTWRTDDGKYGKQEIAQAMMRLYDWEHNRETDSHLVTFHGRYLLNQLRAMTNNEIVGSVVFTVARNANWDLTPQNVHPLGLAAYDPELDTPPIDAF